MTILVSDLAKSYAERASKDGVVQALKGVDLAVDHGELLVAVGPSGSGKTTLLRCIAGLEKPDRGRVEIEGRDVTTTPPGQRDVALVFQEYALYPHLSVRENISFGLRARRVATDIANRKVTQAAAHLGLENVLERSPLELSGGERQRVALARALVREPKAFLLDEPLSNLDPELRAQMRAEIRSLQRQLETATVYVTHDQMEAMTMGRRVAVLRAGTIEQVGRPAELYDKPANAFVARFIGSPPMNLFPDGLQRGPRGAPVVGIRPERIRLSGPQEGRLAGRVISVETIGSDAVVHVDVQGHRFLVRIDRHDAPPEGEHVGLVYLDEDLHGFESMNGRALR